MLELSTQKRENKEDYSNYLLVMCDLIKFFPINLNFG